MLGLVPLNQLRSYHIAEYCANAIHQGGSTRSALHDSRLLHNAPKDAVEFGILAVNPCDGTQPPRPKDIEMAFLTPEEINLFPASP